MILQNPLKTPLRRKRIKVRILKKEATKLIDMFSLGLTLFLNKVRTKCPQILSITQ